MKIIAKKFIAVIVAALFAINTAAADAQEILRDAETEAFFKDISFPLVRAAGLDTHSVRIVLLDDPEVNAFVAGGQVVYINSGLINEAENAEQVQAVIAHELGHIAGGHAIDERGAKRAERVNILSMALGAAAAALGNGQAGMGIMMAGEQAAIGSYLSYTRIEEESADAAGARYLSGAGISGRASIEFFHRLLILENRHNVTRTQDDQFWATHPLTTDRLAILQDTYEHDPAWAKPYGTELDARFLRIKGKLAGYLMDADQIAIAYPVSDTSMGARYARVYAYSKTAQTDAALGEIAAMLGQAASDPYLLEARGEVLLQAGRPADAIAPLREASAALHGEPLVETTLAHALFAQDDAANTVGNEDEARALIHRALAGDRDNPFSWHVLGLIETMRGEEKRAQLAAAEEAQLAGRRDEALQLARRVLMDFPANSPEGIEANDLIGSRMR